MKRKPLFVAYGDIHYHIYNQFNEGDRRVKDVITVQKLIKLESKKLGVPALFLGDLFHNERFISNKLLAYTLPFFSKLWGSTKTLTYAITGNHDQSEQNTLDHESPSYIKTLSQVFPGLICMDFKSEKLTGYTLHGIPYLTHDLGLNEAIKRVKLTKGLNILMLHTTIPGSKDTDGRLMETDTIGKATMKLLTKFDLVITGHIHQPMEIGKNILQLGATNHQRKTDKNSDLGFWVIYNDLSREFKPLKLPKFIELEYGESKPDNKNFYYNKEKVIERIGVRKENSFSNTENREGLANNYIKAKGEKISKRKKEALIKVLKDIE